MLPSLLNEGNQGLVLSFCFLEAVPANLLWITIISPPQSKKAVFISSSHFFFSCLFTFTFSPRFHLSPSPCLRHGPMACTIPSYAKRDGSCSRMETWMHPQGDHLWSRERGSSQSSITSLACLFEEVGKEHQHRRAETIHWTCAIIQFYWDFPSAGWAVCSLQAPSPMGKPHHRNEGQGFKVRTDLPLTTNSQPPPWAVAAWKPLTFKNTCRNGNRKKKKWYLQRPIPQHTFMCAKVCWHGSEFDREHLGCCYCLDAGWGQQTKGVCAGMVEEGVVQRQNKNMQRRKPNVHPSFFFKGIRASPSFFFSPEHAAATIACKALTWLSTPLPVIESTA